MTPEQRAALEALVPAEQRTGDDATDLVAAVREGVRRTAANERETGAVVKALHELDRKAYPLRAISREHGVPESTVRRWAKKSTG